MNRDSLGFHAFAWIFSFAVSLAFLEVLLRVLDSPPTFPHWIPRAAMAFAVLGTELVRRLLIRDRPASRG